MSFCVLGLYKPMCTQISGKSYWGSFRVEIYSYYFCGLYLSHVYDIQLGTWLEPCGSPSAVTPK